MSAIPFNPYIVGNPIKSRQMFFGREDDFAFVQRKIGEARANQIVVLCGERRSGKTSILFQILGGRLGEVFLPVLVDMQMLAGVQGDRDFFGAILRAGSASPAFAGLPAGEIRADGAPADQVDAFLSEVERRLPGRIVLFLFDEYELIESKIRDGTLGESVIHAFCGILESPRRVSFIFTGSTNLEDREGEVWKSLLAKSIYRKISYLSRRDTMRLITEPLGQAVAWPAEVTEAVYRLTGGQPFYTQVICQNMVDLLIEGDRSNPYLNRVMIPHPGMFVGRRALVRRILGRLAGSRPQSLSIVGERRIGKSSLLNFLRSPVARAEGLDAPESCLFVLVDFQQTRALAPERVLSLLFDALHGQAGMTIEGPQDHDGMRRVGEEVAARGCRLVFLFDEFESVTRNPAIGPEFYSFLRSLANGLPLSFVCASGRNLKDMCATREICDSPFFNIFSIVHVGPLDRADADALVRDPSAARGIPLAPLLDPILAMGGRLPFFLQIACSAWYEHLETEGLGAEELAGKPAPAALTDVFREEAVPHFEFILETASAAEEEALRAVASGTLPGTGEAAVQALEHKGYLVREDDRLAPFSAEFARFVRGAPRVPRSPGA